MLFFSSIPHLLCFLNRDLCHLFCAFYPLFIKFSSLYFNNVSTVLRFLLGSSIRCSSFCYSCSFCGCSCCLCCFSFCLFSSFLLLLMLVAIIASPVVWVAHLVVVVLDVVFVTCFPRVVVYFPTIISTTSDRNCESFMWKPALFCVFPPFSIIFCGPTLLCKFLHFGNLFSFLRSCHSDRRLPSSLAPSRASLHCFFSYFLLLFYYYFLKSFLLFSYNLCPLTASFPILPFPFIHFFSLYI